MMRIYRIEIPASVVWIRVLGSTGMSDESPKVIFRSEEPED
jgi:hypothetical protein